MVTVTGPNTGGKTASLKALGLAALMPKAGLFLPLERANEGAHSEWAFQYPIWDDDRGFQAVLLETLSPLVYLYTRGGMWACRALELCCCARICWHACTD